MFDLSNKAPAESCLLPLNTLPDEFTFKDQANITKFSIPVFKHGFKNSNILQLNFNLDDQYTTALNFNYKSFIPQLFANTTAISAITNNRLLSNISIDSLTNSIEKKLLDYSNPINFQDLDDNEKNLINSVSQSLKLNSEDVLGLFLLYIKSRPKGKAPTVPVDGYANRNPLIHFIGALTNVINNIAVGTINTLPYFSMASIRNISKPCLLLVLENRLHGFTDNLNPYNAALTGFWRIFGFRNTISSSDVSTSFMLARDITMAPIPILPNKNIFDKKAQSFELVE